MMQALSVNLSLFRQTHYHISRTLHGVPSNLSNIASTQTKRPNGILLRSHRFHPPLPPHHRGGIAPIYWFPCRGAVDHRVVIHRGRLQADRHALRPLHGDALPGPVLLDGWRGGPDQGGHPGCPEERVRDSHVPLEHWWRWQLQQDGTAATMPWGLWGAVSS